MNGLHVVIGLSLIGALFGYWLYLGELIAQEKQRIYERWLVSATFWDRLDEIPDLEQDNTLRTEIRRVPTTGDRR